MAYSDFTLDRAIRDLGLSATVGPLLPGITAVTVPPWLQDLLARNMQLPMLTEKARGELIVMPVLVACRELAGNDFSIYSGQVMNADAAKGLVGECDFILARSPPLPALRAPIVTIVEAKKADLDSGLGQCAAQMVGARMFNEEAGQPISPIYGCVTTGNLWRMLRGEGTAVTIDDKLYYLDNLGAILAALLAMVREPS